MSEYPLALRLVIVAAQPKGMRMMGLDGNNAVARHLDYRLHRFRRWRCEHDGVGHYLIPKSPDDRIAECRRCGCVTLDGVPL